MFSKSQKKSAIPLDRPVEINGEKLLPLVKDKLEEVKEIVTEIDDRLDSMPERAKEGSDLAAIRRDLLRNQADFVVQREWLTQLSNIIELDRDYLLTIGEAKILGIIKKGE